MSRSANPLRKTPAACYTFDSSVCTLDGDRPCRFGHGIFDIVSFSPKLRLLSLLHLLCFCFSESAEEIGQKHPPDWRLFAFSRRSSAPIAQLLDAQIEPQHSGDKRSSVAPLLRGSDETTERVKRRKCLATNAAAAAALSSDSPVHEQEDKEHVPSQASVPFSFLHKHNYTLETVIVDGPHETMFELLQLARQRNVRHCSLTRLDLGTTILPPEDWVLNRLLQRIDSNHKKSTKCKGEALWLWFVDRLFGALAPRKNGAPMTFLLLDATIASLLELPTLQRLLLLPHTLGYGLVCIFFLLS